jgi:hypothetical protein
MGGAMMFTPSAFSSRMDGEKVEGSLGSKFGSVS